MVSRFLTKLSLLIGMTLSLCLANTSQAAELVANVDRTQIGEYDTLLLTVKYSEQLLSDAPDFSPLEQHFQVGATSRKNSFQMINGQTSSWTIWTIGLTPRRIGNLVIPSLEFRGAKTKPIQIRVVKAADALKQQDKDVFFLTETDQNQAYVQGQIVYTEKLYFAVALDNGDISDVAVADAVVQQLGDTKQYRTSLNGRAYNVFERRYAIYPQTSGELIIPGPRYSGEISNGPWRAGRPIRVSHPPTKLTVLPRPASYQGDVWLPASELNISFQWSQSPADLRSGEPVTLTLQQTAKGLSGSQLPDIQLAEVDNVKYYPDQASHQDQSSAEGVIGIRSQKIAIVPTQAGEYRIPEIRIPWWNTQTQQQAFAVVPAQTLNVAMGATAAPSAVINPQAVTSVDASNSGAAENSAASAGYWPWLTLLSTLLWLTTLGFWWRFPRQVVTTASHANTTLGAPTELHTAKLADIKKACRNNDPQAARQHLLSWVNGQLSKPVSGLSELSRLVDDTHLKQALLELDHTLYSARGNSAWQGEHLWQLLKNWSPDTNTNQRLRLAPLYPKVS